jgi:hypothetical protein
LILFFVKNIFIAEISDGNVKSWYFSSQKDIQFLKKKKEHLNFEELKKAFQTNNSERIVAYFEGNVVKNTLRSNTYVDLDKTLFPFNTFFDDSGFIEFCSNNGKGYFGCLIYYFLFKLLLLLLLLLLLC